MRRSLVLFALVLAAAGAFAAAAAAKEMSVSLAAGPPAGIDPGEPWDAQLLVHGESDLLAQATPSITITKGGEDRTFAGKRTRKRAPDGQLLYRVRVVFPSEGNWIYELRDGLSDRAYEGGQVTVGSPAAAARSEPRSADPVAAAADEDSFPLWPVLGAVAVAFGAAFVAFAIRRQRPQPTA